MELAKFDLDFVSATTIPLAPSKAVIAYNDRGGGEGTVLWYTTGSAISDIISDNCSANMAEIVGYPEAHTASGIYIWEGDFKWIPGGYEYPADGELDPQGEFREPTPEEWARITRNENPFD